MRHNIMHESSDREDTIPIGSLNVLSAKFEVRNCVFVTQLKSYFNDCIFNAIIIIILYTLLNSAFDRGRFF